MASQTTKKQARPDNGNKEQESRDRCNMVFIAGPIASRIGTKEDKHALFLVDCGPDKKYVKCTIHDERELVQKMIRFEKGDYIKIVGFVRIWGRKSEETGEWSDTWEIRVTEIKNNPPERAREFPKRGNGTAEITDDDIPF